MTTFEPPGPGGWKRLADHFPGALTPEYQQHLRRDLPGRHGRLHGSATACSPGASTSAFVHGHLYITPVPLAGSASARRPPPPAPSGSLSRLHPAFRQRTRRPAGRSPNGRGGRSPTTGSRAERHRWFDAPEALQASDPRR